MYPHAYKYPAGQVPATPENWEEINERLRQPCLSLSRSRFTEEDYAKFVQADADAVKEKQVSTSVIPIIEGGVGDAKCVSGGIPFTNFDHLTDGTLAPGNPDIYYGARPEQLDRQIRGELNGVIVPQRRSIFRFSPISFLQQKDLMGRWPWLDDKLVTMGRWGPDRGPKERDMFALIVFVDQLASIYEYLPVTSERTDLSFCGQ